MSQSTDYTLSDQSAPSFRTELNSILDAILTHNLGTAAPSYVAAGAIWIDTATPGSGVYTIYMNDGTDNIAVGQLDTTSNKFTATNHVRTDTKPTFSVAVDLAAFADVASGATCNIGAATTNFVRITGTTTITAFDTVAAGVWRKVRFAAALTLTHNATSLILPGAANITTAANDVAEFISLGSGNWLCTNYVKASGLALVTTGVSAGAGTTCSLNPYAANTTTTQAHGLGSEPNYIEVILECLTADLNYSAGDRIRIAHDVDEFATIWADATNVEIITRSSGAPSVYNKSTRVSGAITAASWKLEATPYLFS